MLSRKRVGERERGGETQGQTGGWALARNKRGEDHMWTSTEWEEAEHAMHNRIRGSACTGGGNWEVRASPFCAIFPRREEGKPAGREGGGIVLNRGGGNLKGSLQRRGRGKRREEGGGGGRRSWGAGSGEKRLQPSRAAEI
ncbi:hypothetical protein H696_04987 [Fonticula alba]|uniref:Uncharacterized protein n=1 Tax=Fonticula alba TaxID=691883 RepID=A0A058Z325_FONAL|nr:hypothetical protein H696_04987 [Fonticula alba]KCV68699.1 hypothetical protein H696_04987 [Fonticula alba]|eukprot:XP_009497131.1 hypothetical protein H696_04987 [Fonticula alba]